MDEWKYYDHKPDAVKDGVDPATYLVKQWAPTLSSAQVRNLELACEEWILLRGQFPWTSVDTASYATGDGKGPRQVADSAKEFEKKDKLKSSEAKVLASGILVSFDFFPPSLTQARTAEHAGAVAARHLVEHFQYHPDIKPAWRTIIGQQFLIV